MNPDAPVTTHFIGRLLDRGPSEAGRSVNYYFHQATRANDERGRRQRLSKMTALVRRTPPQRSSRKISQDGFSRFRHPHARPSRKASRKNEQMSSGAFLRSYYNQ